MSNIVYPYRVPYLRTSSWWTNDWSTIATWCDQCIGAGEWNYYNEEFVFATEQDCMLFKLKWL